MDTHNPKVSIIMGAYNCAPTLTECIESLLNQTYTNWELILCDDGSTDQTYDIAEKYADAYKQIILIQNKKNEGLAYTLNRCLKYAKGDYIARQDGDDRSRPERLEKETAVLKNHPEFDIVSTGMAFFDERGYWGEMTSAERPQPGDFITQSPFCHAPCMIRRQALLDVKGYSTDRKTYRAEDYDLWFRMYANGSRGYNIPEPLYDVRDDRGAIARRKYIYRLNEAYVRFTGYKRLKLPFKSYPYVLRTLIIGILPGWAYRKLRRKRYRFS
ncbi:glycosyltransferase [Salipaludibacillus sp. CUR1]|uniref:glycosyltransferase family 2 protein n=1 Tax=Salipaludibacillus sp. CUR1 TaxID=2820003 RepID=UPI001E6569DF|nr:glycosyltransferase [Salipaludibacillus sp. CUR1]MCE7792508.1 glycosyltransferase [Salipaludibacillus sp. CUR1]